MAKIRELLSRFRSAMLVTKSVDGSEIHTRPLGLQGEASAFEGTLWFFVDDRSRKVREIQNDPDTTLVCQSDEDSRYLQLNGRAVVIADRQKMAELYTVRLKTWFPGGLSDPHLALIRFDAITGWYWDSPGGLLQVLSAFTMAVVTGTPGRKRRGGHGGSRIVLCAPWLRKLRWGVSLASR